MVRSAFNQYEQNFYETITQSLSTSAKQKMGLCLDGSVDTIDFNSLKADPGRVGLESVLTETEKRQFIRSIDLPLDIFQTIHPKTLKNCYQRISSESAWEVKQHPSEIRYSLLAIFLYFRQREIIEGLIELFIQIVHRLSVRAERKLVKELLSDFSESPR